MSRGLFITFEGGEGAGKSTQIRRLAARLEATEREVVVTREPGGSPGAEAIRGLLVSGAADRWSAVSEALLMNAARRDHVEKLITPALARGAIVLCDRFADSTRAYQGVAGGAPADFISALEAAAVGDCLPDLTLVLDLPVEVGLARADTLGGREARFEGKGAVFHAAIRKAFLDIAAAEPARCVVIDASGSPEAVAEAVWMAVEKRVSV
jgi:dTMP kinase